MSALSVGLLLATAGCVSHERYLVRRADLLAVAEQRSGGNVVDWVPAVRKEDHKPVRVRTSALRYNVATLPDSEAISIEASAPNRLVTAGSVLTWIGTAISLFGTGLVAAGRLRSDDRVFMIGGIMALSAEPIMWTGTGLWIGGAMRRPYEAATDSPGAVTTALASTSAPP